MTKKKRPNMRKHLALICFFGGLVMAGAAYAGGSASLAVFSLVLIWAEGLWFYFGRGDIADTIRQTDERQQLIVTRAREYTMLIMVGILLCGAIYEIASGKYMGPFIAMASSSGAVFLLTFFILRARA